MTGDVNLFSDLVEKDLQFHVELGNNERYNATALVPLPFRGSQVNSFFYKM